MPLYDYKCGYCGRVETRMFKMDEAPRDYICGCGDDQGWGYMEKQISAASFILKGTGWYKTDFKGDKPS